MFRPRKKNGAPNRKNRKVISDRFPLNNSEIGRHLNCNRGSYRLVGLSGANRAWISFGCLLEGFFSAAWGKIR